MIRLEKILNAKRKTGALRVAGSISARNKYLLFWVWLFVYVFFYVCKRTHDIGIISCSGLVWGNVYFVKKEEKNYPIFCICNSFFFFFFYHI